MSEITNSAVIKVEIDAQGVEVGLRKIDDGAAKTGKNLENLGRADGFSKLGAGADGAAAQFSGGAKKIALSIERQMASMELGKRGTVEYYNALASQKGINPAILKPYLDQLDAVTRKTAEAAAAQRQADDGAKFVEGLRARTAEIGKSAAELATMRAAQLGVSETAGPLIEQLRAAEEAAGGLSNSLGISTASLVSFAAGVASAAGIALFVHGVQDAIQTLADLDDMSQKTGASVETLSRLQKVAQMTGQDFGAVDIALVKLARGMGGLDEDSNKVTNALKRLGVSSKDAAGKLRDPGDVLIDTAAAFQKYADGAGKTAVANDLVKGSGADLLPFLNDVSENVDKFAGSSAASAVAASAFGDNMGLLKVRFGEMGNVIAVNLLPTLVKFSEYIKDLASSAKFKQFLVDAGKAVSDFASFVSSAYTILVPATKVAAAYFAVFVGAPAIIAATSASLTLLYGAAGRATVALLASAGAAGALNTNLFGTSVAANLASGSLSKLQVAGSVLFAAFAGWEIGTYLREQFAEVRIAGLLAIEGLLVGFENVKYYAVLAFDVMSFTWNKVLGTMRVTFAEYIQTVADGFGKIGATKVSSEITAYAEKLRDAGKQQLALAAKTVAGSADMKKAHEAALKGIKDNIAGLIEYETIEGRISGATRGPKKEADKKTLGTAPGSNAAAMEKEASAYATLIASIKEKISANNLELFTDAALSESQKASIKLDQELASGKLVLSKAHIGLARSSLAELAATEQLLKGQKAQKSVMEEIFKSTATRNDLKESLDVEYKLYGKTADAREMAMVALRSEAEMQKFLAAARKDGVPISAEMLGQLEAERDMRTKVGQATLGQLKAINYAASFADQNRKFSAESIFDEKERASALLAIDAKMWEERIQLAGAGTEAQKQLRIEYDQWYANQLKKPMIDEWKKSVDKYSDIFRTGFADMLNNGTAGWKSFTKSLTTTFKTTVADQIYKMFAQPFVMRIVASLIGVTGGGAISGAAQAAGFTGSGGAEMSSITGIISAAKTAYATISSGFANISASVTNYVNAGINSINGTSGFYGPTASGGNIAGTSPYASGAGTVAGYAAGAAVGVYGGRAISNGYSAAGNSGNTLVNVGTIAGAIFGGPIGAAIGGLLGGAANRLFGMGAKKYGDTTLNGSFSGNGFAGTSDTPYTQKGGYFRSNKSGVNKTRIDASTAEQFVTGYETIKAASADFANVLGISASTLATRSQSLSIKLGKDQAENEKAVAAFFTGVADKIARELLPSIASFGRAGESTSAVLQRIAGDYAFIDVALDAIGKTFGAVGVGSIAARERLVDLVGGLESLGKGSAFFAQNFLSESERLAPIAVKLKASLAEMGLAFVDTRDEFKNVVLGLDLTTEGGAKTYAGLMKIQEAFTQIYPAAEVASAALSERIDLQKEYDDLTMTAAQQLAKQRSALDASNRGLFDQIQVVKAAKAAQEAMRSSLGDVISKMRSFGESARSLSDGLKLGGLSTLTPEQQYGEAKRQYESTLMAAKGGDATAQGNFSSIATAFLEASQKINGGDATYGADFAGVLKTSDEIAAWSAGQVDIAQASLDALNAQVSALGQLNATMLTVAAAIMPGAEALVSPPPDFAGGPNYAAMGTLDMAPMAAEIKSLREEVVALRADQAKQTADLIISNAKVTMAAAAASVDGATDAAIQVEWKSKNFKVALD